MARVFSGRIVPAVEADAGDCLISKQKSFLCLPGLINIGVQKAGTGELQTWLGVHPQVTVHGGEVHFFDRMAANSCGSKRRRAALRLRYARFLWRRKPLHAREMRGRLVFEKTPAYFDKAKPHMLKCALPAARLLVMLRLPAERAKSAYLMCQREMHASWCSEPFEDVVSRMVVSSSNSTTAVLTSASIGINQSAPPSNTPQSDNWRTLRREPHLRRLLVMGHYAAWAIGRLV